MRRPIGYLAHLYTASTVVFVALGAQFTLVGDFRWALAMMGIATLIDATDGALARKLRVKETVPRIDGRRLDDIIDYLSYVFLPMLFALQAGLLAGPAPLVAAAALFASAFGFARSDAKLDEEGFFVGFPSYWNVLVFYLFLFDVPPPIGTLLVLFLAVMVFVPLRYLYPSQLPRHRALNYAVALLWGVVCGVALFLEPGPLRQGLLLLSLLYPAYYTVYSFILDRRSRANAARL